jgi:hypothetical protein
MNNDILLIEKEIKGCFEYFWHEVNTDETSLGYGLVRDLDDRDIASIAAVGFALCAYMIGVERGYISKEEGYNRTLKTLQTIKNNVPHSHGFLAHFVNLNTVEMIKNTEYSTIDTAILLMGAITVGEYFGDEVKEIATYLCDRCDWDYMIRKNNNKTQILMALFPNDPNFSVYWDHYAEQLMMYILYAGKSDCDIKKARNLYYDFERNVGSYKGKNMIYCFGNPLFIHQFTHAFFDFREYIDERGCDWWQNSVDATLANRQFCIDQKWSKTFNENSWGLSATQTIHGYEVYGAPPFGFECDYDCRCDGTVTPYAALSSMPFTPNESIAALRYFNSIEGLNGKYGLFDSYNFESDPWITPIYVGIDKGPTIVMLDNYLSGTAWKYFMQSEVALKAIKVLKFQKRDYINYNYVK